MAHRIPSLVPRPSSRPGLKDAAASAFMTVPECARESHLSDAYWWRKVQRREIEVVRFGRAVRIPRRAFEAFIRRSTQAALRPLREHASPEGEGGGVHE